MQRGRRQGRAKGGHRATILWRNVGRSEEASASVAAASVALARFLFCLCLGRRKRRKENQLSEVKGPATSAGIFTSLLWQDPSKHTQK